MSHTTNEAKLSELRAKLEAYLDWIETYETTHTDAGDAYRCIVTEDPQHLIRDRLKTYVIEEKLLTEDQWDSIGQRVLEQCLDSYEMKHGHIFSTPNSGGFDLGTFAVGEIETELCDFTDDELDLMQMLDNEFCLRHYTNDHGRHAYAFINTDTTWIAHVERTELEELIGEVIDDFAEELKVPTLTANVIYRGMVDYWGGNGRRWDDAAGCLFGSFNGSTTVRQLIDELVEDFMMGGDCDSMWDFDRNTVRKAIASCFKPECLDEQIDPDLETDDEDDCELPVVIVLLEESYDE